MQPGTAVSECKPCSWMPEVMICFLKTCLQIAFWQASGQPPSIKLWGRGENGTVWNIHRGVCSYLLSPGERPTSFFSPRLPLSPVFTAQPKQLSLVRVVSAFPERGAQSWMQRASWSLASTAERGRMASCVAFSTRITSAHASRWAACRFLRHRDSRGSFRWAGEAALAAAVVPKADVESETDCK